MVMFRIPKGTKGILISPEGAIDAGWTHRTTATYPLEMTIADPILMHNDPGATTESILSAAYDEYTARYMVKLVNNGYTIFQRPGRNSGMNYFFAAKVHEYPN